MAGRPIGQRPPKVEKRKAWGSTLAAPENPLGRSTKRAEKMSAAATVSTDSAVQDAMVNVDTAGRCYPSDGFPTDCRGDTQRAHIVKQTTIAKAYPHGAVRLDGHDYWTPAHEVDEGAEIAERRTLQEMLDDSRNIVPACDVHNVDGLPMVKALNVVGVPAEFPDFCREYRFTFDGLKWVFTREVD